MSPLKSIISLNYLRCSFISKRLFYDFRSRNDTIYALASAINPVKGSPLGIIRVSGPRTTQALQHLTRLQPILQESDEPSDADKHRGKRCLFPRRATLAKISDPDAGELLDIGLVLWFPKPNSYTGQDTCELHVHGSHAIIKRLMSILGSLESVRPAEPGEFTRRAVENGKMSLIQAESIPELISAQTDEQRKLALKGLEGATRNKYQQWIDELIRVLAHLEASIDFGEDELIGEQKVVDDCCRSLAELFTSISKFVEITSKCRQMAKVGARVSILGRPNAGKSTLMNILCRQEKSIVSDLSGTTRDVIEHSVDFNGHTLTLCDTAGLRELSQTSEESSTGNDVIQQHASIEREGIRRAFKNADQADLLLFIIDAEELSSKSGRDLTEQLGDSLKALDGKARTKVIHLVINKIDLNTEIELNHLNRIEEVLCERLSASNITISTVSCKTEENIDLLVDRISKCLDEMRPKLSGVENLDYVNERHLALLSSTLKHLQRASELKIKNIDEMAQHVRESVDYLSRIVGTISNEQVFDIIFRDFCIGK